MQSGKLKAIIELSIICFINSRWFTKDNLVLVKQSKAFENLAFDKLECQKQAPKVFKRDIL